MHGNKNSWVTSLSTVNNPNKSIYSFSLELYNQSGKKQLLCTAIYTKNLNHLR